MKGRIEVFSGGCTVCKETVDMVNRLKCDSCEVCVLDMKDPNVADPPKTLGDGSVPALVIDGNPADFCAGRGPDEAVLRAAGLGQPIR